MINLAEVLKNIKPIEKVWGREYVIENVPGWNGFDKGYCSKILQLDPNCQCSLHYHPIKKETFFVLEGVVYLEALPELVVLAPGDKYLILPETKHRFSSYTGANILEISTAHSDEDVVRLEPSKRDLK